MKSSNSEADEINDIRKIYSQRKENGLDRRYDIANPAQRCMVEERFDKAVALLSKFIGELQSFQGCVLDVGCGHGDWLVRLLELGLPVTRLSGVDLIEERIETASRRLPGADLRCVEGALPFPDGRFNLLTAFTVFSSIPSRTGQMRLASEMLRVASPNALILLYDFRYPNPFNLNVHPMTQRRWSDLFPGCRRKVESLTLLPPLARALYPGWPGLAQRLARVPLLRSHQLTLVFKDDR